MWADGKMRRTIGHRFKQKFPDSASAVHLLYLGSAFLAVGLPSILSFVLSSVPYPQWLLIGKCAFWLGIIFTAVGLLLLTVWLVIFIFEAVLVVKPDSTLTRRSILRLDSFPRLIKSLYVGMVRALIESAVHGIVSETVRNEVANVTFSRTANDDDYYKETLILSAHSYKISVKPKSPTTYWRIGLKFSKTASFTVGRFAPGYPLFHLAKNQDEDKLRIAYYGELGTVELDQPLIHHYSDELVSLHVSLKNQGAQITVLDEKDRKLKSKMIEGYSFCQLFAWGDGKEYTLFTKIVKIRAAI